MSTSSWCCWRLCSSNDTKTHTVRLSFVAINLLGSRRASRWRANHLENLTWPLPVGFLGAPACCPFRMLIKLRAAAHGQRRVSREHQTGACQLPASSLFKILSALPFRLCASFEDDQNGENGENCENNNNNKLAQIIPENDNKLANSNHEKISLFSCLSVCLCVVLLAKLRNRPNN